MKTYSIVFDLKLATGSLNVKKLRRTLATNTEIVDALFKALDRSIPEENASFAISRGSVKEVKGESNEKDLP